MMTYVFVLVPLTSFSTGYAPFLIVFVLVPPNIFFNGLCSYALFLIVFVLVPPDIFLFQTSYSMLFPDSLIPFPRLLQHQERSSFSPTWCAGCALGVFG
jgi:hypothetical protein